MPDDGKIDLELYQGREQEYVKHYLLKTYLPQWAYKVGSKWKSVVYVDGFSGPWQSQSEDYSDSSFGVAVSALKQVQADFAGKGRALPMWAHLVEKDPTAFSKLSQYASSHTAPNFAVRAMNGAYEDHAPEIQRAITRECLNPFRFILLDPKGWGDIPISSIQAMNPDRSCEVLINLMTSHIRRFLNEDDRAESYNRLFGREGVLEKLQSLEEGRDEAAVREFCLSLVQRCGFRYVSQAAIFHPDKKGIRYFLVYATNHPMGVKVFKAAEMKAARLQDEVRHSTNTDQSFQPMFDLDGDVGSVESANKRSEYRSKAKRKVYGYLAGCQPGQRISYAELFCRAMSYPLVTPNDLVEDIKSLGVKVTPQLEQSGTGNRNKLSPEKKDWVVVNDPQEIQRLLR